MKTKNLFYSAILFLIVLNVDAQCTQTAFGFGNNTSIPAYNVSGNVEVVLNTNQTVTLNLASNFMTANGPDVRAFLVNPNGLSDAQLKTTPIANLQRIMFGLVSASGIPASGAKTFTVPIPSGINISPYTKVIFYCLNFNQFWDFGTINGFTSSNCGVLSNESFKNNTLNIYPNPSNGIINIELENNSKIHTMSFYNLLGEQVFYTDDATILNKNQIDISELPAGMYIISIIDIDKNNYTKKIIRIN